MGLRCRLYGWGRSVLPPAELAVKQVVAVRVKPVICLGMIIGVNGALFGESEICLATAPDGVLCMGIWRVEINDVGAQLGGDGDGREEEGA